MKRAEHNKRWLKAKNKRKAKAEEFAKRKRDDGVPKVMWGLKYRSMLNGTQGF